MRAVAGVAGVALVVLIVTAIVRMFSGSSRHAVGSVQVYANSHEAVADNTSAPALRASSGRLLNWTAGLS